MLGLPERAPAPPPPASPPQRQASVGLGEALPERGPADAGGEAGMRRVEEDRVRSVLEPLFTGHCLTHMGCWGFVVLGFKGVTVDGKGSFWKWDRHVRVSK